MNGHCHRWRDSSEMGSAGSGHNHLHGRLRRPAGQAGLCTFLCNQSRRSHDRPEHGAGARTSGPLGLHVAHVVIDGGVDSDRLRCQAPKIIGERGEDDLLDIEVITKTYWQIHRQSPSVRTQEVDRRPFQETFWDLASPPT